MSVRAGGYNVLFIISDQHKKAVTGCYGDPIVRTPNIDRLAGEGVRFDGAYCQSPLCGPSRSSVMTGTHCHTCRGLTHTQPAPMLELPTLGSVFRAGGYVTAALGKVHIRGESDTRDLGFDKRALRYYTYEYRDYVEAVGAGNVDKYNAYRLGSGVGRRDVYNPDNAPIRMDEPLMYDALVVEKCIDFLTRHRDERFFLWAGLEKPHPEWYAPTEYHAMYDPAAMILPETLREKPENIPAHTLEKLYHSDRRTDEQVRGCLAAYYANVSYLDAKIGELLAALERLGLAEKTIVIYTSDHGEHLFEHGMVQKHCFYESAVAVPLVMACPNVLPAGARREHVVSLMDLFPTLTDLAGLQPADGLEGESLLDVIDGTADAAGREAYSEFYSWGSAERMIRTDKWKYVYTDGDVDQLYDEVKDPLERVNRTSEPVLAGVRDELRRRVLAGWEMPAPGFIGARPREH